MNLVVPYRAYINNVAARQSAKLHNASVLAPPFTDGEASPTNGAGGTALGMMTYVIPPNIH
jgi:hypothetical protein